MTTRSINLRPWQVHAALASRLRLIVLPVKLKDQSLPLACGYWKDRDGKCVDRHGPVWSFGMPVPGDTANLYIHEQLRCPLGQPGDVLVGKERYLIESNFNIEVPYEAPFSDGRPTKHESHPEWGEWWCQPHYAATDEHPGLVSGDGETLLKWQPAHHMPLWASRFKWITERVEVKRVQEMHEGEARQAGAKEGDWPDRPTCDCDDEDCQLCCHLPSLCLPAFRHLWITDYGKQSWDANPWCWFGWIK